MTSDPSPHGTPEQPETRGAVPTDGQPTPADREATPVVQPDGASGATASPGSADSPGSAHSPAAPGSPDYREVTVRRAPKFVPFMAVGAILGFLAALVVAYTGPVDPTLTRESILGFFTIAFALPGVLLAALLVLVVDRRSVKRAERARAQRTYDDGA
ncbi:hypothetical protein [Arthrobacter bussei]|uniref:hypothetical protein n=1 Tax=Arthrobacter bussei TaxID=2594179 RepID=UPI00177FBEA1|nr:hypothetical protein [Arthrobacter bussei]